MPTILIRMLRAIGWLALAASVGVILATIAMQAVPGPVADQSLWPSPRLWRYFATSIVVALAAMFLSGLLALPVEA